MKEVPVEKESDEDEEGGKAKKKEKKVDLKPSAEDEAKRIAALKA